MVGITILNLLKLSSVMFLVSKYGDFIWTSSVIYNFFFGYFCLFLLQIIKGTYNVVFDSSIDYRNV